ncbi:MAG: 2-oxo acid dehydrogenase subunit E2 [Termitinemataceae bacterium]
MEQLFPIHGTMSLSGLEEGIQDQSRRCKGGTIKIEKLKDAPFTVSIYERSRVEGFSGTLAPKQLMNVSLGKLEYRRKKQNDHIIEYPAISLFLTGDPQVIQKGTATQFLELLSLRLENFLLLLVGR